MKKLTVLTIAFFTLFNCTGCFCTQAVSKAGMKRQRLACVKYHWLANGDLGCELSLEKGKSRYRRYAVVSKKDIESSKTTLRVIVSNSSAYRSHSLLKKKALNSKKRRDAEAQIRQSLKKLYSECPCNSAVLLDSKAENGTRIFPNNFKRVNAELTDLPFELREEFEKHLNQEIQTLEVEVSPHYRSRLILSFRLPWNQRKYERWWHKPTQLLLPVAVVVDIAILPLAIIGMGIFLN